MNIDPIFLQQPLENNILKTIEELTELQSELIRWFTKKPEGFNLLAVKSEIADVKINLEILIQQLDIEDHVNTLIDIKQDKGKRFLEHGVRPENKQTNR